MCLCVCALDDFNEREREKKNVRQKSWAIHSYLVSCAKPQMLGWRLFMYVDVNSIYILYLYINMWFKSHHIPSIIILSEFQDVDQGVDSACWCVSTPLKMHDRHGTCQANCKLGKVLGDCYVYSRVSQWLMNVSPAMSKFFSLSSDG